MVVVAFFHHCYCYLSLFPGFSSLVLATFTAPLLSVAFHADSPLTGHFFTLELALSFKICLKKGIEELNSTQHVGVRVGQVPTVMLLQGKGKAMPTGRRVPLSIGSVYLRGELCWGKGATWPTSLIVGD